MQQRRAYTFCTEFLKSRVDKLNRFWPITKCFFLRSNIPVGPRPPYCWGFEITLRHITLGRTPSNEWSTHRRDLYLTTHNRQTSMPPVEFKPAIPSTERLQTYALNRAAIGVVHYKLSPIFIKSYFIFIRIILNIMVTYKFYILDVLRAPCCQSVQIKETTEQTEH